MDKTINREKALFSIQDRLNLVACENRCQDFVQIIADKIQESSDEGNYEVDIVIPVSQRKQITKELFHLFIEPTLEDAGFECELIGGKATIHIEWGE